MTEHDDAPEMTGLGWGARIALALSWLFAAISVIVMLGGAFPLAFALSLPGWIAMILAFILGRPRLRVLGLVALPILAFLFVCWPILFFLALGSGLIDGHQ